MWPGSGNGYMYPECCIRSAFSNAKEQLLFRVSVVLFQWLRFGAAYGRVAVRLLAPLCLLLFSFLLKYRPLNLPQNLRTYPS